MTQKRNLSDLGKRLVAGDLNTVLSRYADILLAVVIIGLIGIIIVPLPTFLLDLLLATNLTMAVTLLMVSLYVPNALSLASFPSILLITTMFRLSLNISSTRLILLDGDAGKVIEAFGQFVVQGEFVVGIVLFVVITLVQFLVVAKGAERVSEVAARFTLDALPGKQMSIDADLRAGLIDVHEAKRRREYLGRESQFYGAMDGAMKFVKNDAIVGICISLINIAAGLAIGVAMKNLAFGVAAKKYILLTVGDGLVSQLPSLIIAITAGMITTRVASGGEEDGDEGRALGQEIGSQILAQPRPIAIAATTIGLLGLVPGLPTLPLLVICGGGWGLVWSLVRTRKLKQSESLRARVVDSSGRPVPPGEEQQRLPMSQPVILETSPQITSLVDVHRDPRFVEELIPEMREWMFQDLGVHFPGVKVRGDAAHLEENAYTIHVNEVPAARGEIYVGFVFANGDAGYLSRLQVEGIPAEHPAASQDGLWVSPEVADRLRTAGVQLMQPEEYLAVHLAHVLKDNVDQLIGIQDVQNVLDLMEQQGFETLVSAVVPKLITVQRLTDVLKRLLQEDISIKNMRVILESLAHWAPYENDPVYLTEYVRMGLKKYIAHKVTDGRSLLAAYVLDPDIEKSVEDGIRQSASGSSLELDPQSSRAILDGVTASLGANKSGQGVVILTQMEVRYFMSRLLRSRFPEARVLSFQELPSELQIQPIGRIQLAKGALGSAASLAAAQET